MINSKTRMKFWIKLAQTTSPATPIPPPPAFNPVSGIWSWLPKNYNAPTVQYLSAILNIINISLHYATDGKINLSKNQNNIGSLDASGSSPDAKNLILLTQLINKTFLNNGQAFIQPPNGEQIAEWINAITNSQSLFNLSQLNPNGIIAQKLRLSGSLRQNIVNYLDYISKYNPVRS